ncbi:ArsR/SmtB family transcription factor [Fimbriimonas ginsengisoli]|uniref:ArsR-family transcriptional regulator n=1 Tax=Fimbriimonas ginsengisoli Gsoil 348 TaxID=661478 RepID=A0A068NXC7_FIMGI|nr:metalloregulator ArsR/SmtB family transcription factor [Fimbriimonas ginsengisoli]AIE86289.1 ArsR-family transcriptional regulator [Fimbriimonas ginsengisoli Gsoil 348]
MTLVEDASAQRARMFKALGDKTRVQILDFLRQRCGAVAVGEEGDVHPVQGPSFGEVCCHITGKEKVNSTISFHLNELKDAGLITVEKRGKFMVCDVNRAAVAKLAAYLGEPASCDCEAGC